MEGIGGKAKRGGRGAARGNPAHLQGGRKRRGGGVRGGGGKFPKTKNHFFCGQTNKSPKVLPLIRAHPGETTTRKSDVFRTLFRRGHVGRKVARMIP